jgi:hypothetical protein
MKRYLLLLLLPILTYASIGKITALRGDVTIKRDAKSIIAKSGTKLEKHDLIATSKNAKVQIVFSDKTIFTIGKNSTLDIADYLYDESKPKKNKVQFNVLKGAFSSITGRIGKLNKSKFKLKTKSASIGIRGTIVKANQEMIMCTHGAITVTTNNGVSVDVNAGQKTNVSSGTPTTPETITDQDVEVVNQSSEEEEPESDTSSIQDNANDQATNNVVEESTNKSKLKSIDKYGNTSIRTFDAKVENGITTVNDPRYVLTDENANPTESSSDVVTWGHWNDDSSKKWISGQKTDAQVLDNLRDSSSTVNATYNGQVMGTVNGADNIKMDSENKVKVNFALGGGQNKVDGEIGFDTENGKRWNSNFTGDTSGSSFNSNSVDTTVSNIDGVGSSETQQNTGGNVNGQFFGDNAQAIGGTFSLSPDNKQNATGVFKATK